jgi:hypothetical protein
MAGNTPLDQQLADAFRVSNTVLAYVTGIANTSVPTLPSEPGWYTKFRRQFGDAKIHAMRWTDTIVPNLIAVPTGIADFAFTWNATMVSVDPAARELVKNPGNETARQVVLAGIRQLLGGLAGFENLIRAVQDEVYAFGQGILRDWEVLRNQSDFSKREPRYIPSYGEPLIAEIRNLQAKVRTAQAAPAGSSASLFAGACVAVFSGGLGLAIGIVATTATIASDLAADAEVRQLSARIRQHQVRASALHQQIAVLDVLAATFDDFMRVAFDAATAWRSLETELQTVIRDLERADLGSANAQWAKLVELSLKMARVQYMQAAPASVELLRAG